MIDMIWFLKNLKGNPKVALFTDPMWTIPFALFQPFVTMYMFSLGLDDVQIGLVVTLGMMANFVMALFGGVITDKFGRKKTIVLTDFLAWSIPVLIWAFAQNFWWFVIAAMINSIMHIAMVAFECTWVDDTEEAKLLKVINWFHIFWLITSFSALISGYFIQIYSVVPVMRVLYLFAFVSMTIRIGVIAKFFKETKRGEERMAATKDKSILQLLAGNKEVFLQIIRSKAMRRLLIILPIVSIFQMIAGTYFALYATQDLGIAESFLAYFPATRAGISLLFFFFIQNRLGKFDQRLLMRIGIALFIVGHTLLLLAPPQNIVWLLAYAFADAWAAALFFPRLDTLMFSSIDPTERARCRALISVIVIAITSPFGIFAGFLSNMDRRLPFILNMILFLLLIYFLSGKKEQKND